ncbi:DNA/RNA helicase, superfamily I [Saccharomonospora cyanea NA-134]|uniref:DNA 3'-5' helicase n=1 Tax=Saccharomonospora cyanea NA-134 TaxID=882082 RepID=H5XJH6_9PSEU|nr:DNA/RNA helicase, superfamily I [Saccharomonospora cyanea NA-134]
MVRTPARPASPQVWDDGAQWLLAAPRGFVRVLGAPGTGKTTLLAATVAARITEGADPENVLVLTASRKAAEAVRSDITRRLTASDHDARDVTRTVREPLVRTVHSYAFAVLRSQAARDGVPAPRLLSGPEQDVVVRELLAGDLERGAPDWPEPLRPALAVPGFAEELRDLLLRAAERGLGPEDLVTLGRGQGRPEWVAAGHFWSQYEQVTLLQGVGGHAVGEPGAPALDAAELVSSALVELEGDPDLLAREQRRVRHLFVDDAQHLDPLQYRLVRLLAGTASDAVVAGDPDQAVFSFRGADPRLLADADPDGKHTVVLRRSHRLAPVVHETVARIAATLPGTSAHRFMDPAPSTSGGTVRTRLLPTPTAEAAWVADQLRRAHLLDGVPWSEMAVLMRSASQSLPLLQRALATAGVPVAAAVEELPLARQPAVRPLLTVLRVAAEPQVLDSELAEMLLSSPLGGADPLALRRLRRGLRRLELVAGGERSSDELLVEALRDGDVLAGLADAEALPVRRVGRLLATASEAVREGAGVTDVLWRVWQASGLQDRLVAQAGRGGVLGARADRDLDAVVALFDAANRYVERLPKASVAGFAEYLSSQHIVGDSLAPVAQRGTGVSLLTAHGAAGREWAVVAVTGVQEGTWPDLRLRGSLLGVERLVDLLSGVDGDAVSAVSATAPILAEERRLFYVAVSRARRTLLVSAVQGDDEQPSRFLSELTDSGEDVGQAGTGGRAEERERGLTLAELVGELRAAVTDPATDSARRGLAARQLARLARAGVPGAHPAQWYGVAGPSTDNPLRTPDEVIRVSPSVVDILVKCPLRWLLERHGGTDPAQLSAVTGTLVHALAQSAAEGVDEQALWKELDAAWEKVDAGAPWFSRKERARVEAMVRNFLAWLHQSRAELTQHAVEQDMRVELPPEEGRPKVALTGRVDRLELDAEGRPVVVDLKTGKTAVSKPTAAEHPQLAVYQLATLLGAFAEHEGSTGGAKLLYVAKSDSRTGATVREQPPLDDEAARRWLADVRKAAADTAGPTYPVRENADCSRCPARPACPLRPEGRQVTGA